MATRHYERRLLVTTNAVLLRLLAENTAVLREETSYGIRRQSLP